MLTGPDLGAAIESARIAKGVSKKHLAERFGVRPPSIQGWVKYGRIDKSKLMELIHYFSDVAKPSHWGLDSLVYNDRYAGVGDTLSREASNVELALQPTRSFAYPEISWVQAGSATEAIQLSNVAACPRHTSDVWAGENGFWLRVVGNSMTSPAGGDSFPENFLILIAPDIEPRPGQYVVARTIDSNEATFKQLVNDAGELYLKPLNPAFSMRPVDDSWEIVGTVVDGKMPKSVFL